MDNALKDMFSVLKILENILGGAHSNCGTMVLLMGLFEFHLFFKLQWSDRAFLQCLVQLDVNDRLSWRTALVDNARQLDA